MSTASCARSEDGDLSKLLHAIDADLGGAAPVLVLAFASSKLDLARVMRTLKEHFAGVTLIGSTTSGEFTQAGDGNGTVAVFALAGDYEAFAGIGTGLAASPESAVADALRDMPKGSPGRPHRTNIVLLDPFAGHGEEAALMIATELGDAPLVGGAAGDDLAMTKTSVALGDTVASDAIVVASLFSKTKLGVGVCHGHKPFSTQLKVTKAEGSVVLEVDGKPAWDMWLEKSGERARQVGLDPDANAGAYLLRFEAGINIGTEYKVRAPLAPQPGGGILFATPMPEGTVFTMMESTPDAQIESAVTAARIAKSTLGEAEVAGALVFDCICRKLILGTRYADALTKVSETLGGAPIAGFETYGEIAMNSGDMSGFHNTTSVVLAFPR